MLDCNKAFETVHLSHRDNAVDEFGCMSLNHSFCLCFHLHYNKSTLSVQKPKFILLKKSSLYYFTGNIATFKGGRHYLSTILYFSYVGML